MTISYMLDTNIVSDLVRNPQGRVYDKIVDVGAGAVAISIITAAELRYCCAKAGSSKLLAQVAAILNAIDILPLELPVDGEYGGIRAEFEAAGKPLGPNDFLIAAHCYTLGFTLVTTKPGEFRLRGLTVENWLD